MEKLKQIITDTFYSMANVTYNAFDKDDKVISNEMTRILENDTDRENFYEAVKELEEDNNIDQVKVELTSGETLDLVMR